jgi:hypothetical protein
MKTSIRALITWVLLNVLKAASFRCINFYGLETEKASPVCSWKHDPGWYLDRLKSSMGIDSVRLPFSYEYASCNPGLPLYKELVNNCTNRNLDVILDYHRGYASHQGPSPIEDAITFDLYAELWLTVLDNFIDNPRVKALSLFNEFQGGNATDAEEIQLKLARMIESVFPQRFIYLFGCVHWGTNCQNMFLSLEKESFHSRSFIEIHLYDFNGFHPENFPAQSTKTKVFVGEMGWMPNGTEWAKQTITFLRGKRIKDVCLWTIAHSHDTGNVYDDDCETQKNDTIALFNSLYTEPQCLRGSHS